MKVIKFLICLFLGFLVYSCTAKNFKKGTLITIKDNSDSAESIARINFFKKLDGSLFTEGKIIDNEKIVNFRFLKPLKIDKTEKYPLILVFHGSGAIGTDNRSQMGILSKMWLLPENRENFPVYVFSPQFPVRSSNYHLDKFRNVQVSESNVYLDLVLNQIDKLIKTNKNIDENRIYVMGFSMGGATVSNAVSKRPKLFAAAINISGISEFDKLDELKSLPIWIVHGGLDSDNKIESNLKFYREMKTSGNVFFWKYEDKYHNNILSSDLVEAIPKWLFKQSKNIKK